MRNEGMWGYRRGKEQGIARERCDTYSSYHDDDPLRGEM